MVSTTELAITIHFDRRVSWEALIVNRLQRLPANRRDEWLRNLVIAGFRVECLTLKTQSTIPVERRAIRRSTNSHDSWLLRAPDMHSIEEMESVESEEGKVEFHSAEQPRAVMNDISSKPFAQLKRVMGQ